MIEEQIEKIEATLENSENISAATREELLKLLSGLKAELADSPEKLGPVDDALHGLRQSVEGLESSHPEMVGLVNRLATTLSNMGI